LRWLTLRIPIVLALTTALLVAAPLAQAATTRSYVLSGEPNVTPAGTFELKESDPSGDTIGLSANVPRIWATRTALLASAPLQNAELEYEIFFESTDGHVTITYGHVNAAGIFTKLKDAYRTVDKAPRSTTGTLAGIVNGTLTEVGYVKGKLTGITGTIPAGSYPAISLATNQDNSVFVTPSLLTSSQASTATVPLPELPTVALMGLGLLAVGGVAMMNTRKR